MGINNSFGGVNAGAQEQSLFSLGCSVSQAVRALNFCPLLELQNTSFGHQWHQVGGTPNNPCLRILGCHPSVAATAEHPLPSTLGVCIWLPPCPKPPSTRAAGGGTLAKFHGCKSFASVFVQLVNLPTGCRSVVIAMRLEQGRGREGDCGLLAETHWVKASSPPHNSSLIFHLKLVSLASAQGLENHWIL